jgi:hypothetical protein
MSAAGRRATAGATWYNHGSLPGVPGEIERTESLSEDRVTAADAGTPGLFFVPSEHTKIDGYQMENRDFIERLQSKEVAKVDQANANLEEAERNREDTALTQQNSKRAFEQLQATVEALISEINASLSNHRYEFFQIGGGFCVKLGRDSASVTYTPPFFANVGVASIVVLFQQQMSNFAAFDMVDEESMTSCSERWVLEAQWDRTSSGIVWVGQCDGNYSANGLAQRITQVLMDRSSG